MNAKSVVSAICMLFCFGGYSYGELGGVLSQWEKELGASAPVIHSENGPELVKGAKTVQYEKDGWIIRVLFVNNWSYGMLCMKQQKDKAGLPEQITDAELEWLLKFAGGTKKWTKVAGPQKSPNANQITINVVDKNGNPLDGVGVVGILGGQGGDAALQAQNVRVDSSSVSYKTVPESLWAATDGRVMTARTTRFADAFPGLDKFDYTEKDVLDPPAQPKRDIGDDEMDAMYRDWLSKNRVSLEAKAMKEFERISASLGRERGAKEAIDYLKKWSAVTDAKIEGENIKIQYKGEVPGVIHIGPVKK